MTKKHNLNIPSDIVHACADNLFPQLTLTQNPTKLTNPYWQWVVRHRLDPYQILEKIPNLDERLGDYRDADNPLPPMWSFDRLGQSKTVLPDGRIIFIGGEFDDYYDPNFCIFNDVVVQYPNGEIDIYGYPLSIFPPTDFHSATLIGDEIYIIGSMGYFKERHYQTTPVYKLNIHSFKITKIDAKNTIGWINDHTATLKDGQIIIQGGRIYDDNDSPMRENIDEWAFNPKTLTFKNLTNHHWQGFWIHRQDIGQFSSISHQWALLYEYLFDDEIFNDEIERLKDYLGEQFNYKLYKSLFSPPIIHSDVFIHQEKYDEVVIYVLDDIKVRYLFEGSYIQIYIEGQLSDKELQNFKDNLCYKLAKLENCPCQIKTLPFHTPFGVNKKAKKIKRV